MELWSLVGCGPDTLRIMMVRRAVMRMKVRAEVHIENTRWIRQLPKLWPHSNASS